MTHVGGKPEVREGLCPSTRCTAGYLPFVAASLRCGPADHWAAVYVSNGSGTASHSGYLSACFQPVRVSPGGNPNDSCRCDPADQWTAAYASNGVGSCPWRKNIERLELS